MVWLPYWLPRGEQLLHQRWIWGICWAQGKKQASLVYRYCHVKALKEHYGRVPNSPQECIPVGCVPHVLMAMSTRWGGGYLPGAVSAEGACLPGYVCQGAVWPGCVCVQGCLPGVCVHGVYTPRPRGRHPQIQRQTPPPHQKADIPYPITSWDTHPLPIACWDAIHSPLNRMTDRCKNITCLQTSFAGGYTRFLRPCLELASLPILSGKSWIRHCKGWPKGSQGAVVDPVALGPLNRAPDRSGR